MATHSSVLAWRIPRTEEPGGPWSTGSQRVGHDWSDWAPMSLPGKFHGQGSLAGCSPWGPKDSNTPEWLSTHVVLTNAPSTLRCLSAFTPDPLLWGNWVWYYYHHTHIKVRLLSLWELKQLTQYHTACGANPRFPSSSSDCTSSNFFLIFLFLWVIILLIQTLGYEVFIFIFSLRYSQVGVPAWARLVGRISQPWSCCDSGLNNPLLWWLLCALWDA